MATQLTIVNNILRRLREDTVASVGDNTYSALIAQFVNDAKADMEDLNHDWSVYVTEIDTTILNDGTRTYDLTGTNDRSFMIRDSHSDRLPAAYDVTANEVGRLFDCPLKDIKRERALTNTINDVTYPKVFAITTDADGRGFTLELLWGLDSSESNRTWRTYWYVPQADLAIDGSDNDTEIKLPARPVELKAVYYALNERGEEMGQPGGIAAIRSQTAIAAALETDMQVQKKSDAIDITNCENI